MNWIADRKLARKAMDTHYTKWHEIEPLMEQAKDAHTKEVLRRMMNVKRNRANNHGN